MGGGSLDVKPHYFCTYIAPDGRILPDVVTSGYTVPSFTGVRKQADWCSECCLIDKYCQCVFDSHSGEEQNDERHQVMTFTATETPSPAMVMPASIDTTRRTRDSTIADLANFCSRPIKVWTASWGTGTTLAEDFDPWLEYITNPRVSNRLTNYFLLRAKMHLKVVVSGNHFLYGRSILAYHPTNIDDILGTYSALIPNDKVQLTQLPHIYIDPCTSKGGDMVLPFFWNEDYVNIVNGDEILLGQCYLQSLTALKHANGASDFCTISVFAWLEDLELDVPTSVDMYGLVAQSGSEVDEANTKGIVSGPATAAAKFLKGFAAVPTIGPYALATSSLFSASAALAKLFGYSRPAITSAPTFIVPRPTASLALCTAPDLSQKLTLDDKQELTIDTRISGVDCDDPLSIVNIAKREAWFTSFTWAEGDAPDTFLWNARVTPVTWATTTGPPVAYHMPPCCFAAMPFEKWTGTINYRFQVVASTFHRGRLRVVYDPCFVVGAEYNINSQHIIDITESCDFTISVSNQQPMTLLEHHQPGFDSSTQVHSTTRYTTVEQGNGVIAVFVLNELTTPNSTVNNSVSVNVFISAGDDFEVFIPSAHISNFVFKPQAGLEDPTPISGTPSVSLGAKTRDDPKTNLVFTGESIKSLRVLLKRYVQWLKVSQNGASATYLYMQLSNYPYLRGNVPGAVDTTAALAPYNYCNTLPLHWVTAAYMGWRGSLRYKCVHYGNEMQKTNTSVQLQPHEAGNNTYSLSQGAMPVYANIKTAKAAGIHAVLANGAPFNGQRTFGGCCGMAISQGHLNPNIEYELPYQTRYRFVQGRKANFTGTQGYIPSHNIRIEYNGDTTTATDLFVAVGEDFQTYFFVGLPRVYFESDRPTP